MPAVQHMVLLKFKPGAPSEKIGELFGRLKELQRTIPGITYFAGGENTSPEGQSHGHTHGFLMTFESSAARDAYLPHPEHERFKNDFVPLVEAVTVFDFEAP